MRPQSDTVPRVSHCITTHIFTIIERQVSFQVLFCSVLIFIFYTNAIKIDGREISDSLF